MLGSPTETVAITDLADTLYELLPGDGNSLWKSHVSYRSLAESYGVGHLWQAGSKRPMLVRLIRGILTHERAKFPTFMVAVVNEGIVYRAKKGAPLTADELDRINASLISLNFKIQELLDPALRERLSTTPEAKMQRAREAAAAHSPPNNSAHDVRAKLLALLQEQFLLLSQALDRNAAGLSLEQLLNQLFQLEGLAPRDPFRIRGEQIDGSFELDHDIYLVEAKWEKQPLPEAPLLVFRGKVEGKSSMTRGVFFAINGITQEARDAITRGKQPNFFVVDGTDLFRVLSNCIALSDLLRAKRRALAEEGIVYLPVSQLKAHGL